MKQLLILTTISIFLFTSCKKDSTPEYNSAVKADLSVEFDNIAGASDLQLNSGSYTNAAGEVFNVTKLKYYVSNFKLTNADGTIYIVPQDECYFLIDESDEDTHEPVLHIPEGEYRAISFMVGVDSLKSTADLGSRTGTLDPSGAASDMFWNNTDGYIFLNVEGTSTASSLPGNIFNFHIGGFGNSTIKNIRTVTLDLTTRGTPKVKSGKETNIHLMVDVLKIFSGTSNISIASNPAIGFESFSSNIANNYSSMIRHDHTEN
jgi:hypothetical protein